jgi:CheY-like chemotaxis protein
MSQRILVDDRSPAVLTLFDRVLSREGFEVIVSATRMSCLEVEQLNGDLVILGYIQGYLDHELDIVRQLRGNVSTASLPIIISTTGAALLDELEEITGDDRLKVLSKPFMLEELFSAIAVLLAHPLPNLLMTTFHQSLSVKTRGLYEYQTPNLY